MQSEQPLEAPVVPDTDLLQEQEQRDDDGGDVPVADVEDDPPEPSFFAERDEVAQMLAAVESALGATPFDQLLPAMADDPDGVAAVLYRHEAVLGKYQEYPTLLVPHLEGLLGPLLGTVRRLLPPSSETAQAPPPALQEPPVLDRYEMDAPKTALHLACRALYFTVKVAGPKACAAYFPQDVKLLEDVFYGLVRWKEAPALRHEWEVRYALLLWMSSLVLVPFSFETIDSALGEAGRGGLAQQVLDCAWGFMDDASKCREAAALLLARLNTRPDAGPHRTAFFARAQQAVAQGGGGTGGVLHAIAATFKLGKREEVFQFAPPLIPMVGELSQTSRDAKTAKTAVKVLQRLGLSLLRQRAASWRYRTAINSVEANLGGGGGSAAPVVEAAAEEPADGDDVVPDVIEDVIGYLLAALSHTDTIVRWSAAKGIGRVCARLPSEMANDVVLAVIEVFDAKESDSGWHGGLLALAELCRGSILLPHMFERAIPLVASGLHYELSRGSFSVGSHVRDAACYVCWSMARAYNPQELTRYAHALSTTLVTAAVFDREVNVRRAAAAAFQECVGRLGNFPDGIDLVTTMDFFSLAAARNAFVRVAPDVARFAAYRGAMIEHLVAVKSQHWDRTVRVLAATALAEIAVLDPAAGAERFATLLQRALTAEDVAARHGAIVACAELVRTLHGAVPPEDLAAALQIVPTLEAKRLFRGRGGEYVRQACCRLVHAIAASGCALPEALETTKVGGQKGKISARACVQRFLEDSWRQPLEWLQQDAAKAFAQFAARYYTSFTEAFHGKIVTNIFDGLAVTKAPNERRGSVLALGALPAPLLNATMAGADTTIGDRCLAALVAETVGSHLGKDEQDAETRRNAVNALVANACAMGPALSASHLLAAANALLETSLADYAVDKRGDVGSFARAAALDGLPRLLGASAAAGVLAPASDEPVRRLVLQFVQGALKQACEKIDSMRRCAGRALVAYLRGPTGSAAVAVLRTLAQPAEVAALEAVAAAVIDWSAPQESFPLIVASLGLTDAFGPAIADGLVVSVGGLSLHVLRPAQEALFAAFRADGARMTALLLSVVERYEHSERVVPPAFATLERVVTAGFLDAAALARAGKLLNAEARHFAADITKVLACVPLLGALCQCEAAAVREAMWQLACVLIGSRYPKVRSRAAGELYAALLIVSSRPSPPAGIRTAMDSLVGVEWDTATAAQVAAARDRLYPLLEIEPAGEAEGALTMDPTAKVATGQRLGTYKSLVKEMGY